MNDTPEMSEFEDKFFHSTSTVVNSPWTKEDIKEWISLNFIPKSVLNTRISMLRQWLNEDRITDVNKMVTSKVIESWLLDQS